MHRTPTHRRPGFSLIELLVVIVIVALLIGILLPVLSKVRESARAAACMSNMRGLAQATTAYSTDNAQYLPQPHQDGGISDLQARRDALWYNALDYYLGQTKTSGTATTRNYETFKQDPVWATLDRNQQDSTGRDQTNTQTIKMNAYLGHEAGQRPTTPTNPASRNFGQSFKFFKTTDIPAPSSTAVFVDGQGHDTPSTTTGDTNLATAFSATPTFVGLRHQDGANITRIDASAAHEINPITVTTGGYRAWNREIDSVDQTQWPKTTFNFRPSDFN